MHYVYAIAMIGDHPLLETALKIGIARDPSSRLSNMQTGSPFKMAIRSTWSFKSELQARDFEAACHKEFKDHNIMREWFIVTVDQINKFHDSFFTVKDVEKEASDLLFALRKKSGLDTASLAAIPRPVKRHDELVSAPLPTSKAADYIGVSTSWLNKSRMTGTGPTYLKLGGKVRYAITDLENWLAEKRRTAVYDFRNKRAA